MDVHFNKNGQAFEWDARKAASNIEKHGISFIQACDVFFDPFVRLLDATDRGEVRDAALGRTEGWALLFVVHLVRKEDTLRIISARVATPSERRAYES